MEVTIKRNDQNWEKMLLEMGLDDIKSRKLLF